MICNRCIFFHPLREKRKCSALPRVVPSKMEKCAMRSARTERQLAMRIHTPEEYENMRKETKRRGKTAAEGMSFLWTSTEDPEGQALSEVADKQDETSGCMGNRMHEPGMHHLQGNEHVLRIFRGSGGSMEQEGERK